jgi:hypothetical protein
MNRVEPLLEPAHARPPSTGSSARGHPRLERSLAKKSAARATSSSVTMRPTPVARLAHGLVERQPAFAARRSSRARERVR